MANVPGQSQASFPPEERAFMERALREGHLIYNPLGNLLYWNTDGRR